MSADQHVQAVGEIYAAFGRGDVPTILAKLADDVAWESYDDNRGAAAGVPWLQPRNNHAEVSEFFAVVGSWEMHSFQVLDLMASGNQVAAEIEIDATVTGGGRLTDQEVHLWTFGSDGKVTRFRHYTDTAKHIAAAGIAPVPAVG